MTTASTLQAHATEPASPRRRSAAFAAAPALLLAVLLLLPFVDKAFTIDDTVFLRQAEYSLKDPLHPSALTMVWSEIPRPVRLSQVMPTGPLMAWLLMPAVLAGGSEIVAHLLQLAFLLVALVEVAALSLRLGFDARVARLSSLLLASTPAVLGMAGTAMPDVAAMTLGLIGVERLCAFRQEGRASDAVLATLGFALAPLARSHLFALLAVTPFLFDRPTREGVGRQWWPVIAAPLVTAAILVLTRDPLGDSADMVRSAGLFASLGNVRSNAIAFGVHHVLVLPVGLAWMLARGRRFWAGPMPWLGVTAAALALYYGDESRWLWLAPVAGFGVAVVADVVRDAVGRRDAVRIALALWMLLPLPVVIYLHFPSKYLVASAPAAAIVAASAVIALPWNRARVTSVVLVTAGALLGVLILRADAAFAGLGRRAVAELVVPHVAAGERVWFTTHWGFQWYAERAGARCVTAVGPRPARGDLVVSSVVTLNGVRIENFRKRELIASVTDAAPGGRVMSSEAGAGFYSNAWGYLPWAWGREAVDRFELWRVH